MRRKTKTVYLGNVPVGGESPVTVQSMTNTDTRDPAATIKQIKGLEQAGCEIVRVAVPDRDAADCISAIKRDISIPLIADIHFDYRLAVRAVEQGVDGLRINPGNIGARWKVSEVVRAASERDIPIRIGVNAGSLERKLWKKHGGPTAEAMVESGLNHIRFLEELNFHHIKISLKSSDVTKTVSAYRMLAEKTDYPFHIGISEAGTVRSGSIKSAVGLGILLNRGIGDTLRVSLTGDPVEEVFAAYEILKSLNIRRETPEIISCPTCGRCEIALVRLAERVEKSVGHLRSTIKIAVMGCVVNGPGEAREADLGIAGGKGVGLIFKKGKVVRKVKEEELFDALMEEMEKMKLET